MTPRRCSLVAWAALALAACDESPTAAPDTGLDATDVPHDTREDAPDVAPDTAMDALDADDVSDASDTPDVADATDAVDATDARDVAEDTAAPHGVCAGALRVIDGTTLSGQSLAGGREEAPACLPEITGGQLFYAATIPAGHALMAVVTPTGTASWNPALRLLDRCGATSCLERANHGLTGDVEQLSHANTGTTDLPVVLAVGTNVGGMRGTFDLAVSILPLAAHGDCARARTLADGARLAAEALPLGRVGAPACPPGEAGPQLYYAVTVPPRSALTVVATPSTRVPWNPLVRLLDACGAATCVASAPVAYTGEAAVLDHAHTGAAERRFVVAVGSLSPAASAFDLAARMRPLPSHTTCAAARGVASGETVRDEFVAGGGTALRPCVPEATGPALYYRVTVPAGQRLSVTATPLGRWTPVLRLLAGCDAEACLASGRATETAPASLAWTNSAPASADVVLVAGAFLPDMGGTLDLAVRVAPP